MFACSQCGFATPTMNELAAHAAKHVSQQNIAQQDSVKSEALQISTKPAAQENTNTTQLSSSAPQPQVRNCLFSYKNWRFTFRRVYCLLLGWFVVNTQKNRTIGTVHLVTALTFKYEIKLLCIDMCFTGDVLRMRLCGR
jgi:hypothetical protein